MTTKTMIHNKKEQLKIIFIRIPCLEKVFIKLHVEDCTLSFSLLTVKPSLLDAMMKVLWEEKVLNAYRYK